MSEQVLRALVAMAGVVVVVSIVLLARLRERRSVASSPLDPTPLEPGVSFFSDDACRRCDRVRSLLDESQVAFTEFRYAEARDVHRRVGVTGVPLVVAVDEEGSSADVIAGVPRRRRLDRLVAAAGVRPE